MSYKSNITIDQGSDYSSSYQLTNDDGTLFDLTDYTISGSFKLEYTSANTNSLVCTITQPTNGIFTVSLAGNVSSNIDFGRYLYDIKTIDNTGHPNRIFEGFLTITPMVT